MTLTDTAWAGRAAAKAARFGLPPRRRYASPARCAEALDPSWRTSPALELIDAALVELIDSGETDALMIFMPPQEGKSEECSRRLPEWALDWKAALRVAVVSYELDLAVRWGRAVKLDIALAGDKLAIDLRRDSYAAGRWDTTVGGGMYCVGIGGPLTGRPVDLMIIDDPVKDRAAAESERIRQLTWDWWENVALTRLAPGAKVVLIMTRWHEDDLAGRILARPGPLRWRVLRIPAIATEDDPLGRAPGEELASIRHRAAGYFRRLAATMSRYVFAGIYQGKPTAAEGNTFRRAAFRYWRAAEPWSDGRERIVCEGQVITLADCTRFVTMDVAASLKTSADYTVACAWAITGGGDLVLLDRVRARVEDHQQYALAAPLMARWHAAQVWVERSWWSRTFTRDAIAAGIPVSPLDTDTDKLTRALPAAGRVHAGKVWFPAATSGCACGGPCAETSPPGQWLDEWCDELAAFPNGTHDDQVDCLSGAAAVVTGEWVPPREPERHRPDAGERAIADAYAAATGNGHGPDLASAQW